MLSHACLACLWAELSQAWGKLEHVCCWRIEVCVTMGPAAGMDALAAIDGPCKVGTPTSVV